MKLKLKKTTQRPRLAIIGLTSCEGCQFVMLDGGHRFLNLLKNFEVDDFRLLKEGDEPAKRYDICFLEGNVVTQDNLELLKKMRDKSDYLVVVGNCAALGGVWEIKNYNLKKKTIREIYKKMAGGKIANSSIREVDNFVKVDLTIPGCPINGDEFSELVYQLLAGKMPRLPQNPVCDECQVNGYECLLQKGEICLGPITLAGCEAVCLKSKQACWGCRGLFEGAKIENLMRLLKKDFSQEQINRVTEIFGLRDSLAAELNNGNSKFKSQNAKL